MYKYENRRDVLKPFEAHRDYMEARVAEGIERCRKGDRTIRLVDKKGEAIPGARIALKQVGHDFFHGANLFILDEMESEEKNAAYRELFPQCFNLATLPFYWNDLEPQPDRPRYEADSPRIYRRPAPAKCVEYCKQHGITPKAHCLNYDQVTPRWAPASLAEHKKLLDKRFGECAERFAADIPGWEVTNETQCPSPFGSSFFYEDDLVRWSFECARRHFPMNELIINDGTEHAWSTLNDTFKGSRNKYFEQCRLELEHGTPIDAIGLQFHMFYKPEDELAKSANHYDPVELYRVMDAYETLGKPLQVTEVTVPAYSWEKEDEALQAEIITNLYSIWFSHPAMEAVVYWNAVDGYAAGGRPGDMTVKENYYYGGLLRYDMSKKPAWHALHDLFTKKWHTETEVTAGDDGCARVHGFFGTYEAAITLPDGRTQKRTVRLARDAGMRPVTVVL